MQALRTAVELRPDLVPALDHLARLLATHPESQFRNGAEDGRLAKRAVQLTNRQSVGALDSLAAAYAEAGRFTEALSTGEAALSVVRASGNTRLIEELTARLELYWDGQCYRDLPVSP